MPPKFVILDFDGAMTDAEAEGAGFTDAVINTLAGITGRTVGEVQVLYRASLERLRREANDHGFEYDGKIVAPAMVDPYLRSKPLARWVMEKCGLSAETVRVVSGLFTGPLYTYHYGFSGNAPRPGLVDFLTALHGHMEGRVAIVTNSDTKNVLRKLTEIGLPPGRINVVGNAGKFVLGHVPNVPETMHLPGLRRSIYLHRERYYNVIAALMAEHGVEDLSEVACVGDIYELDLGLPEALGCRVGLMANACTPDYETAHLNRHPRGRVLHTLEDAYSFLTNEL